jgi:hypothetical protein
MTLQTSGATSLSNIESENGRACDRTYSTELPAVTTIRSGKLSIQPDRFGDG